jgi:hypothetical protein
MSDYDKTERRINNNKMQYSSGGSRVKTSISGEGVSRVGTIRNHEVYSAASEHILISKDPRLLARQYADGTKTLPSGTTLPTEFDEQGRYLDQWGNKWSPDAEVMPGDTIRILSHAEVEIQGYTAWVKRVRSEMTGTVAAIMMDGLFENSKYVFERGQYEVIARKIFGPIGEGDYLSQDLQRKNIVREDLGE